MEIISPDIGEDNKLKIKFQGAPNKDVVLDLDLDNLDEKELQSLGINLEEPSTDGKRKYPARFKVGGKVKEELRSLLMTREKTIRKFQKKGQVALKDFLISLKLVGGYSKFKVTNGDVKDLADEQATEKTEQENS